MSSDPARNCPAQPSPNAAARPDGAVAGGGSADLILQRHKSPVWAPRESSAGNPLPAAPAKLLWDWEGGKGALPRKGALGVVFGVLCAVLCGILEYSEFGGTPEDREDKPRHPKIPPCP